MQLDLCKPGKRLENRSITLDACEQALLEKISRQLTVPDYKKQRVQTVLAAATGMHNKDIALLVGLTRRAVSKWRKRWAIGLDTAQTIIDACRKLVERGIAKRRTKCGKTSRRKSERFDSTDEVGELNPLGSRWREANRQNIGSLSGNLLETLNSNHWLTKRRRIAVQQ